MPAAVAHQRRLDPVTPIHPAIVQAAVVTDEMPIDLEIRPGPQPDHDIVSGVDRDVAALGTPGAYARRLVEIPGTRLVEEILGQERPHRTEIDHVPGPGMLQALVFRDADVGAVSSLGDV